MPTSLLERKQTHFVLRRPGPKNPPPKLIIGVFQAGRPPTLDQRQDIPLTMSADSDEVWEVAASACGLRDGQVYHYWFEITDTAPFRPSHPTLRCTDPTAYAVDWRLRANGEDDEAAAAVIRVQNGKLVPTDPEVVPPLFDADHRDAPMASLPANDRLVIYEVPTAWTKIGDFVNQQNVGVGTFRDVQALIEHGTRGGHFTHVSRLRDHRHLIDLGGNALELLPPADTFVDRRSWGYATSNYFAPDFDLGRPLDQTLSADQSEAQASNDGKRVLAWKRGRDGVDAPVVVVANFSDWGTADPLNPTAEYVVPGWPTTPPGKRWLEVTQDRSVAPEKVGREPLFPWEAKVYTLE